MKANRHCWVSFRTKTTDSSVYLDLEGQGKSVNVEIWGIGRNNDPENCTNRCQRYTLTLGRTYELYNIVNERYHTGVSLKFEGEPGTRIAGKWSPDFNEQWEKQHNPGWTLIDGSGKERIVGKPKASESGTPIRSVKNPQVLINVPTLSQLNEFPTGCESVSATMLLRFYGINISVCDFIDKYLEKRKVSEHPDPNSAFVGSPYTNDSYGCFAPCIAKAMNKVSTQHQAQVVRGRSLSDLADSYIKNNMPILIWVTMGMRQTRPTATWTISYTDENARYRKGDQFTWPGNEHCVVLLGYNGQDYFVNDPLQPSGNVRGAYAKSLMEERFKEQDSQAVVVMKNTTVAPRVDEHNILRRGIRGEEVRYLQNMLLAIGYDIGPSGADGIFGKATEDAVRALQRRSNISEDGRIGPQTVKAICGLVPHSLPSTGAPNSIGKQYDQNGNLMRERFYGPDGRAQKDIDYNDHGNSKEHPNVPHQHDWDWSRDPKDRRGEGKPLDDEQKNEFRLNPDVAKNIFVMAATAGTGYVIYRGTRMLISALPPLWWTIPFNVAIP